ncbi:MAG TPA: clostripain-related cysteine peptidase [Verrucomicrobiae bacterium]|nr:clostripain-related cysteine peptidase [Verrucomicrobiae bacterium]
MKRFSLWFAVAFVLFSFQGGFSRPTKSQLDSLNQILAPSIPVKDTINYDSVDVSPYHGEPGYDATNYLVAQRFVPARSFTLKSIYFQVDNSLVNTDSSCYIRVFPNAGGYPDTLSLITQDTVPAPLPSVLWAHRFSDSTKQFAAGDTFWIVLGPVPGGPHPDSADIGDGWWMVHSTNNPQSHSYILNPTDTLWVGPMSINWVLRAGGEYRTVNVVVNEVMFNADTLSSDSSRNHEWVELYNKGSVQTTAGWRLMRDTSDNDPLVLETVTFPTNTYLVVHITRDTSFVDADFGDGRGDIYIKRSSKFFNNRKGLCLLSAPPDAPTADQVGWNFKNLSLDEDSANQDNPSELIRIQPQDGLGPLLTATAGISLGRDKVGCDSASCQTGKLVHFVGGPDAAGPTMGRSNDLPMTFNTSSILPSPSGLADWTLMLYMAADYGDVLTSPDKWYYDLLNQIERVMPVGADSANANVDSVNVVVLIDSRRTRLTGETVSQPNSQTFEGALRWDTSGVVRNLVLSPTSVNTGLDTTLSGFISRAKTNYPAARYALALKGDGAGWQGICGDATSGDRLEMGELKSGLQTGLGATKLDLLIFDAPLMSQLEVAAQIKDFAKVMVASPEMTGPADFNYARLVKSLKGGPDLPALVDTLDERTLDSLLRERVAEDPHAVWAAVKLDGLDTLLALVDTLAVNLKKGVEDRCAFGVSSDNYQLKIRSALRGFTTEHYGTQAQGMADFVDLRRLTLIVDQITDVPCQTGHDSCAARIASRLVKKGPVIVGLEGGGLSLSIPGRHRNNPAGLSIYFPSARQREIPLTGTGKLFRAYANRSDHPFDSTGLESEGGVSQSRRVYAPDLTACYPHAGVGCSTSDSNMARNYPYPPVADFNFVDSTHWDEFLFRYYKPVADVESTFYIKNINQPFFLKGTGTSDPDSDSLTYFWDLDTLRDSNWPCDSIYLEDVDKNCYDDSTDDGDIRGGQNINFVGFSIAGDHILWLNVWDDYHLYSANSRFQTDRIKDSVTVQIEFEGVKLAYEDDNLDETYRNIINALNPAPSIDNVDLRQVGARTGMAPNRLTEDYQGEPHVLWTTGAISSNTFPTACQTALNNAMANDSQGVWICGPLVGLDNTAKTYFGTTWGFAIDTTRDTTSYVVPYPGLEHFLSDLDTLLLVPGSSLERLNPLTCPSFPLLINSSGDIVAAARVLGGQRGIIFSTFGLEHVANFNRGKELLTQVLSWMSLPQTSDSCSICPAAKGDLNGDGNWSPADVTLMLNCVFLANGAGTVGGDCNLCYSDVNCSGGLSPIDVTLELFKVYSGLTDPPWCGP